MRTITPLFSLLIGLWPMNGVAQSQAEASQTCRVWEAFVEAQQSRKPTTLLDFSYAGYAHGEVAPPSVDYRVFNVCHYGAIANDSLSDREATERAIEAAQRNGSGVVYFPKGRYRLHSAGEPQSPIRIEGSRIVLRGEGAGADGTELFMEMPNEPHHPQEMWTSPSLFCFSGGGYADALTRVTGSAQRGTFAVQVADSKGLKAGDWVCLRLRNNTQEAIDKELLPYRVEADWSSLFIGGVVVNDYHQIVSVKGKRVTFKEPIMHAVEASQGWILQSFPHIEQVGVEEMALVGNWKGTFVHHKDWLHDGGYKLIEYRNVVDGWIRACRFTDVSEAATVNSSANVSITDCTVTGTLGHNSFHSQGSSRVFMGGIDDEPSQWHSVGVAKPALGTVIWRVNTQANSCFESHASQPRATLLDACRGGFMEGRSGGAIFNSPNHLSDLVLWNYEELDKGTKEFRFWPSENRWFRFLPPIVVGFHGAGTTFDATQLAYEESTGRPVMPQSLYEAQLALRLGSLPTWVTELKDKIAARQQTPKLAPTHTRTIDTASQLEEAAQSVRPGDTLLLRSGRYSHVQLRIEASGSASAPIVVSGDPSGKVIFEGQTRIDLAGDHIALLGITLESGVQECSSEVATEQAAIVLSGRWCRIERCTLIDRRQNRAGSIGILLDRRGNSEGRCQIEGNLFEGFRTHPIRSECGENLFDNNTFKNCSGTLLLRHGARQVVLNNFFLSTSPMVGYGGLELYDGGHLVGCNYFYLPHATVGGANAAIQFHRGATSAGSTRTALIKNLFIDVARCALSFERSSGSSASDYPPMGFLGNLFFAENTPQSVVMDDPSGVASGQLWEANLFGGLRRGAPRIDGLAPGNASLRYDDSKTYVEDLDPVTTEQILRYTPLRSIEGIPLDVVARLNYGCSGSPRW